jgi:hypothetical protein
VRRLDGAFRPTTEQRAEGGWRPRVDRDGLLLEPSASTCETRDDGSGVDETAESPARISPNVVAGIARS